jgi:hypothetical protein
VKIAIASDARILKLVDNDDRVTAREELPDGSAALE